MAREVYSFPEKLRLEIFFFGVVCLCACCSFFSLGQPHGISQADWWSSTNSKWWAQLGFPTHKGEPPFELDAWKLPKVWKIAVLVGIIEDHSPRVICYALRLDKEKFVLSAALTILDQTFSSNCNKGNSMSRPAAKSKETVYNRYTPDQNQVLKEFYSRNPHPDASDRKPLGEALGLTDDRIKYWFQNRRAVDRRKSNKSLNEQLKEKNDILRIEIETWKLTHLTATCDSSCMKHPESGSSSSSSSSIERLKLENACMKDMIDKMNKQLEKYSGIERRYSPDPDDGNQQPAEGPSNPGIYITEPLSEEIDPDLFFHHSEEDHQSLD